MTLTIIMIIIAYLIGSLSSAIIVCKFMGLPDPRTEGSGNPGTTNVLRLGGKFPAAITLLGDALKGSLPVMVGMILGLNGLALGCVAIAAILGHIFPVFFKFQGGKGVATSFGALLTLSLTIGAVALVAWIIVVAITRYVSLASIVAAATAVLYSVFFAHELYFLPILIIAIIIIVTHRENINRLKNGTENKLSF